MIKSPGGASIQYLAHSYTVVWCVRVATVRMRWRVGPHATAMTKLTIVMTCRVEAAVVFESVDTVSYSVCAPLWHCCSHCIRQSVVVAPPWRRIQIMFGLTYVASIYLQQPVGSTRFRNKETG